MTPVPAVSQILPTLPQKENSSWMAAQSPHPLKAREYGQDAYLTAYSCKSLLVATIAPTKAGKYGISHTQELKSCPWKILYNASKGGL